MASRSFGIGFTVLPCSGSSGMVVRGVRSGTRAALGGLLVDDIILEINGFPIKSVDEILVLLANEGLHTTKTENGIRSSLGVELTVERLGTRLYLVLPGANDRLSHVWHSAFGFSLRWTDDGQVQVDTVSSAIQTRKNQTLQAGDIIRFIQGEPVCGVNAGEIKSMIANQTESLRLSVQRGKPNDIIDVVLSRRGLTALNTEVEEKIVASSNKGKQIFDTKTVNSNNNIEEDETFCWAQKQLFSSELMALLQYPKPDVQKLASDLANKLREKQEGDDKGIAMLKQQLADVAMYFQRSEEQHEQQEEKLRQLITEADVQLNKINNEKTRLKQLICELNQQSICAAANEEEWQTCEWARELSEEERKNAEISREIAEDQRKLNTLQLQQNFEQNLMSFCDGFQKREDDARSRIQSIVDLVQAEKTAASITVNELSFAYSAAAKQMETEKKIFESMVTRAEKRLRESELKAETHFSDYNQLYNKMNATLAKLETLMSMEQT